MTQVRYDHLLRLSTPLGVYEHAVGSRPDVRHGYCLDDVGRVLVVLAREPDPTPDLLELLTTCVTYTISAGDGRGRFRNRRRADGAWSDQPFIGDHWGRGLWGLSQVAVSPYGPPELQHRAHLAAVAGMRGRTPWRRSVAHAVVAAADLWRHAPGDPVVRAMARHARAVLEGPPRSGMPWPERRLTYANALLPEAHLAVGEILDDEQQIARGLRMLEWLVGLQTVRGHLSVIPVQGWLPGEPLPAFDQQPIEAASLAEAAARAHRVTGHAAWADAIDLAAGWFLGRNDAGRALYDPETGGGYDGLRARDVNHNQGAESTLAALSTLQLASRTVRAGS